MSNGDEQQLREIFTRRREERKQFGAAAKMDITLESTPKERAMYAYLRLVLSSKRFTIVTCSNLRAVFKNEYIFSMPYIKKVILKLTALVE